MQPQRQANIATQNQIQRIDHSRSARHSQQHGDPRPVLTKLDQHVRNVPQGDLTVEHRLKSTRENI